MRIRDREGKKIGFQEWNELQADQDYFHVAHDWVPGGSVSTVWLGIDHGAAVDVEPLIFETLTSGGGIERYATEAEALEGHRAIVERLKGEVADG